MYTDAMRDVAAQHDVLFVDAFAPSKEWYGESDEPLTIDGFQLSDAGYERLAALLASQLFKTSDVQAEANQSLVHDAGDGKELDVAQRLQDPERRPRVRSPIQPVRPRQLSGGDRQNPPDDRDPRLGHLARPGRGADEPRGGGREDEDAAPVQTNYEMSEDDSGVPRYLYGQEALDKLETAPGYEIELFASEKEFEDLANPVQLSFDNQGRLWVATMPSYPHYKPGDGKPNDKLLILEDLNGDGRADWQTVFADSLHLPVGFELAPEGVYVSQGTNLVLLTDTDGDDKADTEKILLSGFDDHDTHHAHSAYTADPSGAIYMAEGVFLHTNVETPYGPVRATNGGFYRYSPQRHRLERTAQLPIPNPWGIAFDEWGQNLFAETSSPDVRWMMPGSVKPRYGVSTDKSLQLIEDAHRVRPTSGLEFVSSRHFPDEVQGDLLINNTIGFLGTKQHAVSDSGTGYTTHHRLDLVQGTDPNFRPVDMEFASRTAPCISSIGTTC